MRPRLRRSWPVGLVVLLASGCVGQSLLGEVQGIQTKLQRAIRDGSKAVNCAPKDTAVAEANIRFAQDALAVGEYYRGKQHADAADYHTQRALARTDPQRCRDTPVLRVGDLDGDGYDDEADRCPEEAEDFDSFEDEDGCPDRDNDQDGIFDAARFEDGRWINLDRAEGVDCRNQLEDLDQFQDEDGCPDPDNDEDGVLDGADACPDQPEDVDNFEDQDGCPDIDNDGDRLCDPWVAESPDPSLYADRCTGRDQCPDRAEDLDGDRDDDGCPDLKAEFDGCAVKITEKVFFKSDKWDIDPRSYELLDDVATVIQQVPAEVHFRVEGHTDSKGSGAYNRTLSQRRADSVARYLQDQGVAPERLQPKGFGEDQPIDTNRTGAGRARNRRVEFNVSNVDCRRKP